MIRETAKRPEFSVKDRVRTLEFDGVRLAASSSFSARKPRWVEFELYRTLAGVYIVSRVGYSTYFHDADCFTTSRNHLSAQDGLTLPAHYVPCDKCNPFLGDPDGVYPETPRAAAWQCSNAVGVVASLMKEDNNGVEYLTNVARRLLMDASELDPKIHDAFFIDRIE